MTRNVQCHMNKTEEEPRLSQRHQQQFLGTTCQRLFEMPNVGGGVVTPPTRPPSKMD